MHTQDDSVRFQKKKEVPVLRRAVPENAGENAVEQGRWDCGVNSNCCIFCVDKKARLKRDKMDPAVQMTLNDIVKRAEGRMNLREDDWSGLAKCFLIDAVLFINRRSRTVMEEPVIVEPVDTVVAETVEPVDTVVAETVEPVDTVVAETVEPVMVEVETSEQPEKEKLDAELALEERLSRIKSNNEHPPHLAGSDAGVHSQDRGAADGRVDEQGGRVGLVGGEDERADEQAGVYTISDEFLPVEDECGTGYDGGCCQEIWNANR
jgi:hypothetical protein